MNAIFRDCLINHVTLKWLNTKKIPRTRGIKNIFEAVQNVLHELCNKITSQCYIGQFHCPFILSPLPYNTLCFLSMAGILPALNVSLRRRPDGKMKRDDVRPCPRRHYAQTSFYQHRKSGVSKSALAARLQVVERRHAYPAGRAYQPRLNYLQLSDRQCRRRLRLSQETVTSLCEMLAVDVSSNCIGGHPMPVALKVTIALNFYASGSFQASAADLYRVSQAAVHHCIKVVTDALFRHANYFITFKTDDTSQAERARGFSTISGFPMVQGVIDCTHVALRAPAGQSGAFINRKGYHSMNVQLVCDHHKRIMQVCAHYPGSCHDAFILRNSLVPALFNSLDGMEGWILGVRGYPLKTWLMTPVRKPRGHAEERYNESHAATRVTIEQTIGLLKMRFRCLDRSGEALQYAPSRVSRIIVICCALHNLAIENGTVGGPMSARCVVR
ncbi:putative nuclease HARBI1 [Heterodontus francisci]|uniref:putative nuclease HARBI1 n=1 Tax=Heterodontus francisci TaxID=7792 RepID=UPI00355B523A